MSTLFVPGDHGMSIDYNYLHELLNPCKTIDDPLEWWEGPDDFGGKFWLISRIFPTLYTLRLARKIIGTDSLPKRALFYDSGRVVVCMSRWQNIVCPPAGHAVLQEEFPTDRILDQCKRLTKGDTPPLKLPHWSCESGEAYHHSVDMLSSWLPVEELAAFDEDYLTLKYHFLPWRVTMLWDHYVKGVAM